MADRFRQAVVQSVALSCLLTMDFVPGTQSPPAEEMVSHELPRVLHVVTKTQFLGGVEAELHTMTHDPAGLLERVTAAVKDVDAACKIVTSSGHRDMVYSALSYMRKPPMATRTRIARMTRSVAEILGVNVPCDFDESVGDMYDAAHGTMIRV